LFNSYFVQTIWSTINKLYLFNSYFVQLLINFIYLIICSNVYSIKQSLFNVVSLFNI